MSRIETLERRRLLSADLAVTIGAPRTVLAGGLLTYDISITNHGDETASQVSLVEPVPADTTLVETSTSTNVLTVSHLPPPVAPPGVADTVEFSAVFLKPNDVYQAEMTVRVSASLDEGVMLTDSVQASSNTADPTPDDDSASVSTTVHRPAVLISGNVYLDANADGVRQPDERVNPVSKLFIDLNGNGTLDVGEPSDMPDGYGNYQFALATPGTYIVRDSSQPDHGFQITSPPGGAYTIVAAQGSTFSDLDFGHAPTNAMAPVFVTPDRFGPAGDVDTALINGLYRNVLGRNPDPAGFAFWHQALVAGVNRDVLVNALWNSPEHRTEEVDFYYANYLHRAADPAGFQFWLTSLEVSGNEQAVVLALVTSPEYLADHASDNDYVTALYNDILSHQPDADGLGYWLRQMQNGAGRLTVAETIINSNDSSTRMTNSFFTSYLHRDVDFATGALIATGLQQHRFLPEELAPVVLASDEYLADARAEVTAL
ncbi:MAG TPA: DUF4214 domain-containing protein [Pirellulales bacterium]|nr:DUF4214 domain-containing protein [Pirellulales bacterium]